MTVQTQLERTAGECFALGHLISTVDLARDGAEPRRAYVHDSAGATDDYGNVKGWLLTVRQSDHVRLGAGWTGGVVRRWVERVHDYEGIGL